MHIGYDLLKAGYGRVKHPQESNFFGKGWISPSYGMLKIGYGTCKMDYGQYVSD